MPESANPRDHNPFSRLDASHLQPLIGGYAGAEHRRRTGCRQLLWNVRHIERIRQGILREPAIDGIAPILLAFAQRLPAGHAVIAMAAGAVQPWYAHPVAFLNAVPRAASDRDDHAGSFMTGDERRFWLYRPISFRRVKIRMTHATGFNLHQNLAGCRFGHGQLLDL